MSEISYAELMTAAKGFADDQAVSLDYLTWFIQQLGHANMHGALVEGAMEFAGRILGDGLSTWVDLRTTELVYLRDEVGMLRYHAWGFMHFMGEASYVDPTAAWGRRARGVHQWC